MVVHGGGACVVALGGGWGACVVAPGGGHAWLLQRDMCGCSGGHAWLLPMGVCGCSQGGVHGCSGGACMVAPRGASRLLWGGMCGCSQGVCGCSQGGHAWLLLGVCAWDTTRYGDTVNERAVRILLECILVCHSFHSSGNERIVILFVEGTHH